MRSYSTPESAHRGEVTKLAIVEALASVALYVGICTYAGSWKSLAIIVVGAPLMLVRTEVSADWAIGYWKRWAEWIEHLLTLPSFWKGDVAPFLLALISPIVGIGLRVTGTVYWAIRMPVYTLREAPANWFRQTLCTDFMHPPEIIPLETLKGDREHDILFVAGLDLVRTQKTLLVKLVAVIFLLPFLLIGWLPSAVYRISFKATAIVYAPFIWAAHATTASDRSLKFRLERIRNGELEKFIRGFSWIVIGALAAKAGLILSLVDPTVLTERFTTARAVELVLVPGGWPWWQVTLGTAAVLTFILLFFADAALARHESTHSWPERTVLDVTATISFVRVALGLLTITYFFGVALRIAFPAIAWPW